MNQPRAPVVIYEYLPGEMWDRRPVTARDLSKLLQVWHDQRKFVEKNPSPIAWELTLSQ